MEQQQQPVLNFKQEEEEKNDNQFYYLNDNQESNFESNRYMSPNKYLSYTSNLQAYKTTFTKSSIRNGGEN